MRTRYDRSTDSLYIELRPLPARRTDQLRMRGRSRHRMEFRPCCRISGRGGSPVTRLFAILLLILLPSLAPAQEAALWTTLSLSETVEREVAADRMVVRLRLERRGADPRILQAGINETMAAALERAAAEPEVRHESGRYEVYASAPAPEQRAEPVWTAVQELILSGGDAGRVLALAGALQEQGLVIGELRQDLSPERGRAVREELIAEATQRLRQSADATARGLGLRFAGWQRVAILGGPEIGPRPYARGVAMMAEAMAAPVAATAEIRVAVTLEGEARLVRLP
jgi:predicted secreted protein